MTKNEKVNYYLTAFLIAGACCLIFYPGIFSTDSLSQINQAISSNYNSWHPAIMAILMHYLYKPFGVGGLFVLHQFLYWLAWALFFDIVLQKRRKTYLLTGFFTPFFLISLTVWKDTGMLIALFLGLILLYHLFIYRKYIVLIPITILWIYAFNVRTNAFIIVSTLIFTLVTAYCFSKKSKPIQSFFVGITSVVLLGGLFFSVNFAINKYYNVRQISALPSLVLYDAAGTYSNANLNNILPPTWAEKNTLNSDKNWIHEYNEKICSLCWTSEVTCDGTPELNTVYLNYWIETILKEPVAYVKHRLSFTSNLYGINFPTFFPYQSHKQQKKFSSEFHINSIGVLLLYPMYRISDLLSFFHLYQPALYILLSVYCLLESFKRYFCKKEFTIETLFVLAISSSSIVNALTLAVLAVSADYRYMIWSVFGGFISMLLIFKTKNTY